jgi:hypothetical protein
MVNYSLGKIYKIVCNITGETYIGSTCQKSLSLRLSSHKSIDNKTYSRQIIERDNFSIVLLEDYPCQTRDQLRARERHWIDSTVCINKNKPLTDAERDQYGKKWRDSHPDYMKEWYANHPQYMKEWLEKHPDYLKVWNTEHPDYHAKWYAEHKKKAAETKLNEEDQTIKNSAGNLWSGAPLNL